MTSRRSVIDAREGKRPTAGNVTLSRLRRSRVVTVVDRETELALVKGIRAGEEAAFDAIHAEFNGRLFGFLARLTRRREIAVRTAGIAPSTFVDSIRTTMAALDPDLPLRRLQPAQTTIVRANYQEGVLGSVLSGLAVLGLGLATLGVYGVTRPSGKRRVDVSVRRRHCASLSHPYGL